MTSNLYTAAYNHLIKHGNWNSDSLTRLGEAGSMELVALYLEETEAGISDGYTCQAGPVYSATGEEITNFTLPYYGRYNESFEDVVNREYSTDGYSETLQISIQDCHNPQVDFSEDPEVLAYLLRLEEKSGS